MQGQVQNMSNAFQGVAQSNLYQGIAADPREPNLHETSEALGDGLGTLGKQISELREIINQICGAQPSAVKGEAGPPVSPSFISTLRGRRRFLESLNGELSTEIARLRFIVGDDPRNGANARG